MGCAALGLFFLNTLPCCRPQIMSGKKSVHSENNPRPLIQFSLAGLTVFVISLVASAVLLLYGLYYFTLRDLTAGRAHGGSFVTATRPPSGTVTSMDTPGGELIVQEINLQRPQEYIAFTSKTNQQVAWGFGATPSDRVRGFLASCGFTPTQVTQALSPQCFSATGGKTVIQPDDSLVLSLSPKARAGLYVQLAQLSGNPYQLIPFACPDETVLDLIAECDLDAATAATFRKLVYPVAGKPYFSDPEVMLRQIPTPEQRDRFMQCLLQQRALLVRLQVRPDTDVDKILGYWAAPASGVRYKDVRTLLDSLKQNAQGGSVSILYLLPPFARQRLYTFPLLTMGGSGKMSCHWSTFNFFNETPDDRFSDVGYLNQYLIDNYYQIAAPSAYGDVILILDNRNNPVHSAVQIAGDIVFTKNGASYDQPWDLMHLKDVLGLYAAVPNLHTAVWRKKSL
jgi:hypothetical protein